MRPCARALASFTRPPAAKGPSGRAPVRRPSPHPPRREARARPPPAADRVVGSARRASPPSVHITAAPEPGSSGRPGGGGGWEVRDEKPAKLGVGVPCEERAGGDELQGGLDRRVGGLPTPPRPASGPRINDCCIQPGGGPRLA